MARKSNQDNVSTFLFATDEQSLTLTSDQREAQMRWRYVFSRKLDDPMVKNSELVEQLMSGADGAFVGVARSTAYSDINCVQTVLGNIRNANKEWIRYMIAEGAKEAFRIAKENKDAAGMAAALDKLGKYSRADKDDETFDMSAILPPVFEPTDDVTVLDGIVPIDNLEERRRELRALHGGKMRNIQDVDIEEEETDG